MKPLPSQEILTRLLRYDPDTGKLYWRERAPTHAGVGQWNGRYAGKEAFTATDQRGYLHGKIDGTKYQAHRVIWKLVTGVDPNVIDHVNGKTNDNRMANLRSCTPADNSRNYAKPAGSTSRYRGVCWVERDKAWAARISDGSRGKVSLGNYRDEVEAARAYDRAAIALHGDFAVLNFPEARIRSVIEPDLPTPPASKDT